MITDCKIIHFPIIENQKGKLSVIEQCKHIPFQIKRIYYMYETPKDAIRGNHAHMQSENILIPLKGSFTAYLNDSVSKKEFILNDAAQGLYIPPKTWLELTNFSTDSLILVLSSELYNKEETITDYDLYEKTMFKTAKNNT